MPVTPTHRVFLCLFALLAFAPTAFAGCIIEPDKQGRVSIPTSWTSIPTAAFEECEGLTTITIPNNIIYIDHLAFSGCIGLTRVTIPSSVTSIGDYIFRGCSRLSMVILPSSVTSVGVGALPNCYGYGFGLSRKSQNSRRGLVTCLPFNGTEVTIPSVIFGGSSVVSIGESAFYHAFDLQTFVLPTTVTSIGRYAFHACSSLQTIEIPDTVTSIDASALPSCFGFGLVLNKDNNPRGLVHCLPCTTSEVTIPTTAKVRAIGPWAFSRCSMMNTISIPNSVQRINEGAFYRSGLTAISIPSSIVNIANDTFMSCGSLTMITMPDTLTEIGDTAFKQCSRLTSVVIPRDTQTIGSNAFAECSSLQTITIPLGATSIGDGAFGLCGCDEEMYTAGAMLCDCLDCSPTASPTISPTTLSPTLGPTVLLTVTPTHVPSGIPTVPNPTRVPSRVPTRIITRQPTNGRTTVSPTSTPPPTPMSSMSPKSPPTVGAPTTSPALSSSTTRISTVAPAPTTPSLPGPSSTPSSQSIAPSTLAAVIIGFVVLIIFIIVGSMVYVRRSLNRARSHATASIVPGAQFQEFHSSSIITNPAFATDKLRRTTMRRQLDVDTDNVSNNMATSQSQSHLYETKPIGADTNARGMVNAHYEEPTYEQVTDLANLNSADMYDEGAYEPLAPVEAAKAPHEYEYQWALDQLDMDAMDV
eukprot:m.69922 g.69922  ORF g.69922 m.69922 type:complete len:698 (+) comp24157_c0_seq1:243-2336(+)